VVGKGAVVSKDEEAFGIFIKAADVVEAEEVWGQQFVDGAAGALI